MIRLVESASGAERVKAAVDFLLALAPSEEALVVGASRDAADELVRRVTRVAGVTFGILRASLLQLAARTAAADLARLAAAPATSLGTEAIAARVTFEAMGAGKLGYLAPVARFPGSRAPWRRRSARSGWPGCGRRPSTRWAPPPRTSASS